MAGMESPTVVIIPGAATPVELYSLLRSAIEARGFETACSDPPSITADNATAVNVENDVEHVRETILAPLLAANKQVVVLMHSYGGTYGAAAVKGLSVRERIGKDESGGVLGLIYAASFCTEPGQSALDALGLDPLPSSIIRAEKPGTLIFSDPSLIWPNTPIEKATLHLQRMKPCAISSIASPIIYAPYRDPFYHGAIAYIGMEDDLLISKERQHYHLKTSGITLYRSVKGGHGIDLEATEALAEIVREFTNMFLTTCA
ncbi:hypothetical protein BX600DRAFT_442770 [Xylariales sp. PMI_506]|nr:hypothetical protein BX600DRAFT_442770 [Xylariales sp. PMI_506]